MNGRNWHMAGHLPSEATLALMPSGIVGNVRLRAFSVFGPFVSGYLYSEALLPQSSLWDVISWADRGERCFAFKACEAFFKQNEWGWSHFTCKSCLGWRLIYTDKQTWITFTRVTVYIMSVTPKRLKVCEWSFSFFLFSFFFDLLRLASWLQQHGLSLSHSSI